MSHETRIFSKKHLHLLAKKAMLEAFEVETPKEKKTLSFFGLIWVVPLPSNSHHQDCYVFRIGDPNLNLHFPRLHPGRGDNPRSYGSLTIPFFVLKIKLFEPTICLPAMNPRSLGATRRRLARLLWGQGELCRGVSELCWGVLKNPVGVFTIKIQTQLSMVMYLFCFFFLCIYIYVFFCISYIYQTVDSSFPLWFTGSCFLIARTFEESVL